MLRNIKIKNSSDDPFAEKYVQIDIEKGTKILSNEPYVKELYDLYMGKKDKMVYANIEHGKVIDANVISKNSTRALLEIDGKHTVSLSLKNEKPEYIDYISPGSRIAVKLNKSSYLKDEFTASFSDAIKTTKLNEIYESIGKPVAYNANVKQLVYGGYLLDIDGIEVFMPGSLASMNILWDFESLLNKTIIVMPINYSKQKNTIVVSRREYLSTLLPAALEEISENMNKEYSGKITGTTKFGIFAEFNECVTGLIPSIELNDEWNLKFKNRTIKPGDDINFLVKDLLPKQKVILTQIKENPWDNIEEKYKVMQKVTGKISGVKNYGYFVELEPNIVGLLHESEIKKDSNFKFGDDINLIIRKIDKDNKKIEFVQN